MVSHNIGLLRKGDSSWADKSPSALHGLQENSGQKLLYITKYGNLRINDIENTTLSLTQGTKRFNCEFHIVSMIRPKIGRTLITRQSFQM